MNLFYCSEFSECPKCVLPAVGHVKETIFILIFLVNCRQHSRCNKTTKSPDYTVLKYHISSIGKEEKKTTIETFISPVGGKIFLTKMKIAFSGPSLILFRTTYTNWPTVRSAGTRYLHSSKPRTNNFITCYAKNSKHLGVTQDPINPKPFSNSYFKL